MMRPALPERPHHPGTVSIMKSSALVLLFADDRNSLELGQVLWAAVHEVAGLYGALPDAPEFWHFYFARKVPDVLRGEAESTRTLIRKLFEEEEWERTRGRYSRTWDARRLIEQVRALLSVDPGGMIVVFDHEITPPSGWRYIIWDGAMPDSVVSVAPTDPLYWSEKNDNRLAPAGDPVPDVEGTLMSGQAQYMGEYGLLKPKDMPLDQFLREPGQNPFNALTYAVVRVGIGETRLSPRLDFHG